MGEIDICAHRLFCTNFNFKQLLFEKLFDIIGYFGSIQPENESTFAFQYNLIFETRHSFESPNSTGGGGGRHECPLTFLYEI